jgi:hypothetical protein
MTRLSTTTPVDGASPVVDRTGDGRDPVFPPVASDPGLLGAAATGSGSGGLGVSAADDRDGSASPPPGRPGSPDFRPAGSGGPGDGAGPASAGLEPGVGRDRSEFPLLPSGPGADLRERLGDLRLLLAFESDRPLSDGRKEREIREVFGVSPARYYQRLNAALEDPEALTVDPQLVNRLRRIRDERRARRESNRQALRELARQQ